MKVIISILLSLQIALCEVPPPYPSRGFRPNPPFNLPVRQPQQTYGVPNPVPSKFSQPSSPQTQYGAPNQGPSRPASFQTQSFSSKQTIPSTSYGVPVANRPIVSQPQTLYGVPNQQGGIPALTPSFSSKQTIPGRPVISQAQVSYGAPNQQEGRPALTPSFSSKQTVPNTSYGVPVTTSPYRTIINEPQVSYSGPNNPSTQYDIPDTRNIETLEQIRQLNQLLQSSQSSKSNQQSQIGGNLAQSQNPGVPSQQYLPLREPSGFRNDLQSVNSQQIIPAQQYLPVKEATNFRNNFDLLQGQQQNSISSVDGRVTNPNFPQPQQQYLPVRDASNFQKSIEFPQGAIPQRNINTPNQQRQLVSNINPNLENYDTPRQNNIEIQQLNVRRLQNPKVNENNPLQIPSRISIGNPALANRNRELGIGSNIQSAGRQQIDDRYLPPSSTVTPDILRPSRRPDPLPRDRFPEVGPSTASPEQAGGPNIAVSTAVAGTPPDNSFYLLQPDGRLQKVIYQKTRSEGDGENEYTANYQFQNIQPNPGLVYSPLLAVGKK